MSEAIFKDYLKDKWNDPVEQHGMFSAVLADLIYDYMIDPITEKLDARKNRRVLSKMTNDQIMKFWHDYRQELAIPIQL